MIFWFITILGLVAAHLAPVTAQAPSRVPWQDVLSQDPAWYESPQARAIADGVLRHQRASGGWPKDVDMTTPPPASPPDRPDATIDNGATTTQIRFLARIVTVEAGMVEAGFSRPEGAGTGRPESAVTGRLKPASTTHERYASATSRGIDYLLDAQYANGGWPQFFPLRSDYSRHITFNDNAMVNVVTLLDDVARARTPFGFVDERRRSRAADALKKSIALILKAQVVVDGTLTVWCAQHDEVTLEPRGARAYEHPSLSGAETVGIVKFLMRQPRTPEIVRSIDAAVAWLQRVRLPDGRWARFYEIHTNRPIFSGRDGIVRYSLSEIEEERRDNYAWYGTWGKTLVDSEYARWKAG